MLFRSLAPPLGPCLIAPTTLMLMFHNSLFGVARGRGEGKTGYVMWYSQFIGAGKLTRSWYTGLIPPTASHHPVYPLIPEKLLCCNEYWSPDRVASFLPFARSFVRSYVCVCFRYASRPERNWNIDMAAAVVIIINKGKTNNEYKIYTSGSCS